jgi:NADPH:quinone reductase-like Zn-dependent oxidoreductase
MKAVVQDRYGPAERVLTLHETGMPVVGSNEVLVRVCAASVHVDVWHVVTGRPLPLRFVGNGLLRPKRTIPGTDLAGRVESIGPAVTRFRPGDEVFGQTVAMSWLNGGAFAEYAAVPQDMLALKPDNVTFEQAAAVPTSGAIALRNLRAGQLAAGHNVLINGAGGNVGSLAVQIAKADGARVTGVDRAEKGPMVSALGADSVIDFSREDVTRGSERYDLILDVASTLTLSGCMRVLTPTGVYVFIGHDHFGKARGRVLGSVPLFFSLALRGRFNDHLPDLSSPGQSWQEIMADLQALLGTGKVAPIIARAFPLSEVRDAMRFLQEGKALGHIVVTP